MKDLTAGGFSEPELRYERKFLVEELDAYQARVLIRMHPALFTSPYPPRQVNSLYLDDPDLGDYYDNVGGAAERKKVRLRWYGGVFGEIEHPALEIKFKRGLVGGKQRYPLAGLRLAAGFGDPLLQKAVQAAVLPQDVRSLLKGLRTVLLNSYQRQYFVSADQRFRLTLDTGLVFYQANQAPGNSFIYHQRADRQVILELKYDSQHEMLAQRVAGFFPFRATRSSKYVQGMERVYL